MAIKLVQSYIFITGNAMQYENPDEDTNLDTSDDTDLDTSDLTPDEKTDLIEEIETELNQ